MKNPLSLTLLALVLAAPASASAYGYAPDGTFVLPPEYGDFFDLGGGPAYDPFGAFPSALTYVAEGTPQTASAPAPDEGRMTLIGRRHRLRIQLECPPGRVSRVPADGLVPRCSP